MMLNDTMAISSIGGREEHLGTAWERVVSFQVMTDDMTDDDMSTVTWSDW